MSFTTRDLCRQNTIMLGAGTLLIGGAFIGVEYECFRIYKIRKSKIDLCNAAFCGGVASVFIALSFRSLYIAYYS